MSVPPAFRYQDSFPLGPDGTDYDLLPHSGFILAGGEGNDFFRRVQESGCAGCAA